MSTKEAIEAVMALFAECGVECDHATATKLVDLGMAAKLAVLARKAA